MPISVGSVSVDVVPNGRRFNAEMKILTRDLTAEVRLELEDKKFEAEVKEATRTRTAKIRVDDQGSIKRTDKNLHVLSTTLIGLAPAAAPIAAVALGGVAAFTGLGLTGVLAVKGIQAEMKAGTPDGVKYTTMLTGLKGQLAGLEKIAAQGVLDGVTESVEAAQGAMPQLQTEVTFLSRSLGSDLAPITKGILGLFKDLDPVVNQIADGAHDLAVEFEGWANGPGGREFAAYMATELPIVARTLGDIFTAGGHVVQALLPLGGPVLKGIEGISTVIAHIPVDVIDALFVAFGAYKVVQYASAASIAYTKILKTLGIQATVTAGELDGLAASEGAAGRGAAGGAAAGGAAGGLVSKYGPAALGAGIGVSALKTLPLYGVGAQQDTLDNPVMKPFKAYQSTHPGATVNDFLASNAKLKTSADTATPAIKKEGDATATAAAQAAAAAAATTKWATSMDAAFTAAAGMVQANINVHQAAADATKALKENGQTLDLNTQKGRDNQTALLNVATAQHAKIDADIAGHASQKTINTDFSNGQDQLYLMARRFGDSRVEAQKYVNKLLGIPKDILTTVHVGGIVASEAQIKELKRKEGALQFYANQKDGSASGSTGGLFSGGRFHYGTGGPVFGAPPGVDTKPAWLNNGEYVIDDKTVDRYGAAYFKALQSGRTPQASLPSVHIDRVYTTDPDAAARAISQNQREVAAVYALASA